MTLFEVLSVGIFVLLPFTVHAGVIASIFGVFGEDVLRYERSDAVNQPATEVKLLSSLTNPDPEAALGGGDLIVDEDSLVSSGPFGNDVIASGNNGEISLYTVREGDSLSQIAEMFDVTTNTILWANDLNSATDIHPGDDLVILPIVGVRHIVKKGDTISSIAKKYDSDAEEILNYNQLASAEGVTVGSTLIIPGGNLHETSVKVAKSNVSSGGSVKVTTSASSGGGLTNPLPGSVKTQGLHGYNAVDLAGLPSGSPVVAAASGEVIVSRSGGWNGGYGSYVVIKHSNGTQTLYAHLSSVAVAVGQKVSQGQKLGGVGSTGKSTGVHLHFEVRGSTNPF